MSRPRKQTADYFPHYAVHGKTMYVLQARYGLTGYAAWFKLLELLCLTPGHCYWCLEETDMAFLAAKIGFTDAETANSFLVTLAMLGAIDKELWHNGAGIWSQNLVDNLGDLYRKRHDGVVPSKPGEPVNGDDKPVIGGDNLTKGGDNPQTRLEETRENKTISVDDDVIPEFRKYHMEHERQKAKDDPDKYIKGHLGQMVQR